MPKAVPALRRNRDPRQRITTDPSSTTRTGDEGAHRFSRNNRLVAARGYRDVFAHGNRSRDTLFTVLYRRRSAGPARLGLAVSKKNCKLATGRNRIKRQVRESFRRHKEQLNGMDIVVMNTRGTAAADNLCIAKSLARHWARLAANKDRTDG